jgi:hypothetical protein
VRSGLEISAIVIGSLQGEIENITNQMNAMERVKEG